MKRFIGLLLLFLTQSLFSQTQKIPKDSLLADFDTLFSTIEQVHVDMYANLTKDEFEKKATKIKAQINKDMTAGDFYLLAAPLVAKLGDGHTSIWFPINVFQQKNPLLFPFNVNVDENDSTVRVVSYWGTHGDSIPQGAIITAINNIPIKQIIAQMMSLISGERDFFKLSILKHYFVPLLYFENHDTIFKIDYIVNDKKEKITCKADHALTFLSKRQKERKKNNKVQDYYSFRILKGKNTGFIDFKEFEDYDKFKVFLDSVFTIMKTENIPNLIIDIRNNGGGNSSLGDELFQYISPVPFQQFGKIIIKSPKETDYGPKGYAGYFLEKEDKKSNLKIYNDTSLVQLRKNKLRYTGHVYLLISHFTFSSAASFSWAFKYFKMGSVVGEESGGMAVTFGDVLRFTLPHSKLMYGVSYKKFYMYGAKDNDIHGTIPDYKVKADSALDYTLDLIKNKTQKK